MGMEAVLLDRHVKIVDEVSEVIEERGGAPPWITMEGILQSIPEGLNCQEREAAIQRATDEAILRFRTEVEAPAEAVLRERKAARPSKVAKVPVHFPAADAGYYREALDGVEPVFPELAVAPGITSMVLRASWSRASVLRSFPPGAFISSVHHNIFALYVGPYRPGLDQRGFYLVYDARTSRVTVIPRLPSFSVTMFSHCSFGAGVNVLQISSSSNYILAELLLRKDNETGRTSNKATLFRWWSSLLPGCWVLDEVVLPLPSEPDEHTSAVTYTFYVDTMFAVGTTCLCWADLLQGILLCKNVPTHNPEFRFIPLPEGCSIKVDPGEDRGLPDRYRSMSCVERGDDQIITFVSMDGHGQGRHISNVELTTWTLKDPSDPNATWTKGAASFCIRDLWSNWFYKEKLLLGPLTPTVPVLSMLQDNVVYISVDHNRLQLVDGLEMEALIERHILSLDLQHRVILSAFKTPRGTRVNPHLNIIAININLNLFKMVDSHNTMYEVLEEASEAYDRKEKGVMSTEGSTRYPFTAARNVGLASLLVEEPGNTRCPFTAARNVGLSSLLVEELESD